MSIYSDFISKQDSGTFGEARKIMEVLNENVLKMKPFTKNDYDGFGGVEGKNPHIGENHWGVVVHDDKHVEVHHGNDDGSDMKGHSLDAGHPAHAAMIAHTMLNSKTRPSDKDFKNLGFEKVIG